MVEYFQSGFGIWPGSRTEPATVAFTAKGGDQVRWDNGRNWSTGDLPIDGDEVKLDGHEVYYSGTRALQSLDLGSGGVLRIHQGRLTLADPQGLTAAAPGGSVHLDRSGYLILDGFANDASIDFFVRNGRLENRGNIDAGAKLRIEASGGELRLAGDGNAVRFGRGCTLRLLGHSVQAGYFGNNPGTICFEDGAVLSFSSDENGVSTLGEMGSDALNSTLSIIGDESVLEVDLAQLRLPPGEHQFVLVNVDRLEGRFGTEKIAVAPGANIAEAKIVYDFDAGEMRVDLVSKGP